MTDSASGPPRQRRRDFAVALAASCGLHAVVIALWLSFLRASSAGVPWPAPERAVPLPPAPRTGEMVYATIEFRRKPLPVRRQPAARSSPLPSPKATRRIVVPRPAAIAAQPESPAGLTVRRSAPSPSPAPERSAAVVATLPSVAPPTPTPMPTPRPSPAAVAEAGLWGLDAPPVLLDSERALLGSVRHRLRIEVRVDADGRATDVRVEDAGGDQALASRVRAALLSAHYAAARCNNLPCTGSLVFAYPRSSR